ncbi:uncharacterized protein LOC127252883 isoform X2 [Andrographis paniculata]|uniref:uncharacterized protein LOC127252883 isoform X2 n=1 Tax=Andrographis paniculata TaxID=175694 RepID=UPI0021E95299|nr:uncharacterized protein LOC127252883 isoform X2 [Andrographis paniculata]
MAALQAHVLFLPSTAPSLVHFKKPHHPSSFSKIVFLGRKFNVEVGSRVGGCCRAIASSSGEAEIEKSVAVDGVDVRPPFDINLAVILAGFAFEAYTTPSEKYRKRETDAAKCQTVFLSESFVREIYDGQLFVKLKRGFDFPAMDPWGTSDPYVVMQLDCQVVKSNVKWGTKEPTWNEEFALNIKLLPGHILQAAAWDANLVTPHKRMGNAGITLDNLCDGNAHEVLLELEGMGGGGKIEVEIKYKSFEKIDEEKKWWKIPIVTEFLEKHGFEPALKLIVGSETVQAREFVQFAFGQLKSINDSYLQKDWFSNAKNSFDNIVKADKIPKPEFSHEDSKIESSQIQGSDKGEPELDNYPSKDQVRKDSISENQFLKKLADSVNQNVVQKFVADKHPELESNMEESVNGRSLNDATTNGTDNYIMEKSQETHQTTEHSWSDKHFWKKLANSVNHNFVKHLDIPVPEKIKWDGFDLLKNIGLQSQEMAEASYIESGLAIPNSEKSAGEDAESRSEAINIMQTSLPDIKKVTQDLLRQTDSILGAMMVVNAAVSKLNKELKLNGKSEDTPTQVKTEVLEDEEGIIMSGQTGGLTLTEKEEEEMRALFSTAESAMEAWAMLANAIGHPTFIKSEFEKICFLDNSETDTQVAIWRDLERTRLVIAFRGTEQSRWKDLRTDLMLVPAGLNPERIGGDSKEEVQVHSGFLSAYDSVRTRLITLIKQAINHRGESLDLPRWHIYVTGHSLGGALATLLALELSSSQLAKRGAIKVTMYNFGSPRVGNRRFAKIYNEKVKDSWRVVNHRDIIPTVPRLMGYCHVAQPVYLATGDLKYEMENMDVLEDGYQGDVIGEATPDVLVTEFMRGEKELVEKILNTEINIFRAIRDGSALMQHMEDFYYITLLENVRSNYQMLGGSKPADETFSV